MEGGKEMVLLVSFYISPNSGEDAELDPENTLNDLQTALEHIKLSFKDVGIVLVGDHNKIGIDIIGAIASSCELQPVFLNSATHEKGNHLDQIYTNLLYTVP